MAMIKVSTEEKVVIGILNTHFSIYLSKKSIFVVWLTDYSDITLRYT